MLVTAIVELELLNDEHENAPRKALLFPRFHQVVNVWLSDRKSSVKGDEGAQSDTRPVPGVLKLCRLDMDDTLSLKQKSASNTDEDKYGTPEGDASKVEIVSEAVSNDCEHAESNMEQSLRCPRDKAPVHRVRNDVRNKYLTNLGIVPNQGGAPAMSRKASIDETNVVEVSRNHLGL